MIYRAEKNLYKDSDSTFVSIKNHNSVDIQINSDQNPLYLNMYAPWLMKYSQCYQLVARMILTDRKKPVHNRHLPNH